MTMAENPIGVFDSGTGGISTLKEIVRLLPCEDIIYYGDTANAPYGTKSTDEVMNCVYKIIQKFNERNIKALVIACNTATSVAAAKLRKELKIPVIGIEPALKPAAMVRKNGHILVLATPVTLSLPKFGQLMALYGEGAIPTPCPGLMELIEKKDTIECRKYLEEILSCYDSKDLDAVVLGCTHYVFLRPMLRQMLPEHVMITDGNEGTAKQLQRVLQSHDLERKNWNGMVEFMTSGTMEHLSVMKEFFMNDNILI